MRCRSTNQRLFDLHAGQAKVLKPALFHFKKLGAGKLRAHREIKGMPFFAKINQSHFIQLDQLLPHAARQNQVNLVGESKGRLVSLREATK